MIKSRVADALLEASRAHYVESLQKCEGSTLAERHAAHLKAKIQSIDEILKAAPTKTSQQA